MGLGDLSKGTIATSPHKNQIIDGVQRFILEEHHVSGPGQKALNIKESARDEVRVLFANNIWTGELAELLDYLKRKLDITD